MKRDDNPDESSAVIHIDSEVEKGIYCNAANIAHSPSEFILDFIMVLPGDRKKVVSRILTSPVHAKQLTAALVRNIEKYEKTYGEVDAGMKGPEFEGPVN